MVLLTFWWWHRYTLSTWLQICIHEVLLNRYLCNYCVYCIDDQNLTRTQYKCTDFLDFFLTGLNQHPSLYHGIVKVIWRVFNQLNVCFLFWYAISIYILNNRLHQKVKIIWGPTVLFVQDLIDMKWLQRIYCLYFSLSSILY